MIKTVKVTNKSGKLVNLNLDLLVQRYIKINHNPNLTYNQVRDQLDQKLMQLLDEKYFGE